MFFCSCGHQQDWQPYPVDPYSCSAESADRTCILERQYRSVVDLIRIPGTVQSLFPLSSEQVIALYMYVYTHTRLK